MARFFVPISKRKPDPEPVKTNPQGILLLGTAVWVVVLILLMSFFDSISSRGFGWWLYTSLVGIGLGIFGFFYVRARKL